MKTCKSCDTTKDISEFYKQKGCTDGVRPECKKCFLEKGKIRIDIKKNNSEYVESKKEYMKTWNKNNKDKIEASRKSRRDKINSDKRKKYANDIGMRKLYRKRSKEWQANNKDKRMDQRLKKYGITYSEYKEILSDQKGGCAICGAIDCGTSRKDRLHVDHNHLNGNVRGLLCVNCNHGIGKFKDNVELLKNAIRYLEKNN